MVDTSFGIFVVSFLILFGILCTVVFLRAFCVAILNTREDRPKTNDEWKRKMISKHNSMNKQNLSADLPSLIKLTIRLPCDLYHLLYLMISSALLDQFK